MSAEYVYRTGRSWGVTIVRVTRDHTEIAHPDDGCCRAESLIATAQTQEDADLIVAALNTYEGAVRP